MLYEISINKEFYLLSKKFEYNDYNLIYEISQNTARSIALIDYLKEHTEFRDKYLAMIKEFISASNDKSVLDKESLKAIEAEEDAIEDELEDEDFEIGAQVIVVITKYDYARKLVYGKIVAKW